MTLFAIMAAWPARAGVSVVDDAGRVVELSTPASRVVLTDGMGFLALALLDPHPEKLLAGWNRARMDGDMLTALRSAMPAIESVPDIGEPSVNGASLEKLIALEPDLIILDPFYSSATAIQTLTNADIPVAVLALTPSVRDDDMMTGLKRLAVLLGRQPRAEEFSELVQSRLSRIRNRLVDIGEKARPPVLFEAHASAESCCISTGNGRGIGDFVGLAGGFNIGAAVIPGMAGPLSLEYIIGSQPQVYIGTGGSYMAGRGGLVVGPSVNEQQARASLHAVLSRKGLASIPAVESKRAYGLSHGLAISVVNIVAIEAIAKWVHPELFRDVDPQATLDEIGKQFLPASLAGTWWVEAGP
ncbi:MAG: ABC transporter substrate-binding protein [Mesorhizobium sp.]